MERYDYMAAMKEDIKEYIRDNYTTEEIAERLENRAEWEETLNDDLWTVDSVTGNASGSYTFCTYTAEEYIAHNLDLLAEALHEFCDTTDYLEKGAEACDVTIRCYLLYQAIGNALDEIENEMEN
jgi:hypothetical protein